VFETLDAVVRLALDDLRQRRVIPSDIQVPEDGLIAERLSDVRLGEPAPAEPTRIVSDEHTARTSMTTSAVKPPAPADKAPRATVIPVATHAPLAAAPGNGASAIATTTPAPAMTTATATAMEPRTQSGTTSATRRASSLAPLFGSEDQETVRTIEDAMSESILPRAILLLEALMVRVLERTGRMLGRADAPHEAVAWTLGIPAERYSRLRAAAQRARRGGEVSRRDALEAYVVVSLAQIASDGLLRD
jgi:hypothetical protein